MSGLRLPQPEQAGRTVLPVLVEQASSLLGRAVFLIISELRLPQLEQAERTVLPVGSASNLPIPQPNPFVTGQFVQPHWAAGADLIGADANFCAHAKFPAIGEPG
jgi:hypothetical protein